MFKEIKESFKQTANKICEDVRAEMRRHQTEMTEPMTLLIIISLFFAYRILSCKKILLVAKIFSLLIFFTKGQSLHVSLSLVL